MFVAFSAFAETIIVSTAQSQFRSGTLNQGWWSDVAPATDSNDYYYTGRAGSFDGGKFYRSFFSFKLPSFDDEVISATLSLTRRGDTSADQVETLGLFSITTDARPLNNNVGINPEIFEDLGSGTSYGNFLVDVFPCCDRFDDILDFVLNDLALADINVASGDWFSIGGALQTFRDVPPTPSSSESIFELSGGYVATLTLITDDGCKGLVTELGDNRGRLGLDRDVFKFDGVAGETVTVSLSPFPEGSGVTATLVLVDDQTGEALSTSESGELPSEITSVLPISSKYSAIVRAHSNFSKENVFRGDYCIELESQENGPRTLEVTSWVE